MENRIYGIVTIVIVSLIFWLAFKKYKIEKYEHCLYFIILAGLILRIFTSCDLYLHEWDERYHALVAKNLIDNPFKPMMYKSPLFQYDYKNWAANHIWVHKQPFPIYSMALSMLIFGKNVIALRIPSIILSTISIFSTYKIGQFLGSKKIGIIAAFLFSINGLIIEQTAGRVATDHIDVFFFSLVSLAVYFLFKHVKYNSYTSFILGSIITGLAILSKWLPALIVLPIWILFSINKHSTKKIIIDSILFMGIVTLIVIPWQFYISNNFPLEASWEYEYNKMHFFEALGQHGKPFYYHLNQMRIIFGELVYLPFIWLIYSTIRQKNKTSKLIVLTWIALPYIFFSFAATKMQGYILLCAPAIFIMIAMFFEHIQNYRSRNRIIISLISILLLILPIRFSIERIKPFSIKERKQNWITELKKIEENELSNKMVIFNCKNPIESMFHSDVVAYEIIPDKETLEKIRSEGYQIYLDNNKTLPKDLENLEFIKYIKLTGPNTR